MSAIFAVILDFSKILFCTKLQQKKSKEEIKTNFVKKLQFLFQSLICIINYGGIRSDVSIQLTLKDALIIGMQVLKVSF